MLSAENTRDVLEANLWVSVCTTVCTVIGLFNRKVTISFGAFS